MKFRAWLILLALAILSNARATEVFRVAAYNVENYLDQPTAQRAHVKSDTARAKIRESIRAMNPDVLALEEMGTTNALLELRDSLKKDGIDFPFWEHIQGFDTNIHVAVLSKLPLVARHPHTNDFFLLDGKRYQVKRGFIELEIQATTNFSFTLLTAHLKSQLSESGADEAEQRLEEAKVLRGIIDAKLKSDPEAKIIVAGDLNDGKDSESTKEIIGRGKTRLFDTRPAERDGDMTAAVPPYNEPRNAAWTYFYGKKEPKNRQGLIGNSSEIQKEIASDLNAITWTYHYAKADSYERIDYLLLSPAMVKFWIPEESFIPKIPEWRDASDHRPICIGIGIPHLVNGLLIP